MKKVYQFLEFIKPFLVLSLLFLAGIFCIKIFETVYCKYNFDCISFLLFLKTAFWNICVSCLIIICILPVFLIINLVNRKIAIIITSIIFAILIITELGLTFYYFNVGVLLKTELFQRPLNETLITIGAYFNIYLFFIILIGWFVAFVVISLHFVRKKISNKIYIIFPIYIFLLLLCLISKNFMETKHKMEILQIKNYFFNKTFYAINSIRSTVKDNSLETNTKIEFDGDKIKEFLQEYPQRNVPDLYYPLEYENKDACSITDYFPHKTIKPNIVIIIAESLGVEWTKNSLDGFSYVPFFDSLSHHGLLWKNCLSTSERSYGAIPAITGSVPYGFKGFQFGKIPNFNSLFSVLKNENYQNNFFKTGVLYFDALAEYLETQNIDYIADLYADYEKNKNSFNGEDYWGYHDSIMFTKSFDKLNADPIDTNQPLFNLFVTVSSHQTLHNNNPLFKTAFQRTREILSKLPVARQKKDEKIINEIARFVYLDMCLQQFFNNYKKRADFDNTIFIITGDHASGLKQQNDLSAFHVPLLIWSPMLTKSQKFESVVSHNDITPTICALLKQNFAIKMPEKVHWIGDQLNNNIEFQSKQKTMLANYGVGLVKFVYNNYYFDDDLYQINDKLSLSEIKNDSLKNLLRHKFDNFKYIHKYVYLNDKLTKTVPKSHKKYKVIINKEIEDLKMDFLSNKKWERIELIPSTTINNPTNDIKNIRLTITADMQFSKIPTDLHEFMEFFIGCEGNGVKSPTYYSDVVCKYLLSEDVILNEWNKFEVSKTFNIENVKTVKVQSYIFKNERREIQSSHWKNINIKVEVLKIST